MAPPTNRHRPVFLCPMEALAHLLSYELQDMTPEEANEWLIELQAIMARGHTVEEACELLDNSKWGCTHYEDDQEFIH